MGEYTTTMVWRVATGLAVSLGAALGWFGDGGDGGDLAVSLGDAIAGALTGGTVVLIAALMVKWVNGIADRRDRAAGDVIGDYRQLLEDTRSDLRSAREEIARLSDQLRRFGQVPEQSEEA